MSESRDRSSSVLDDNFESGDGPKSRSINKSLAYSRRRKPFIIPNEVKANSNNHKDDECPLDRKGLGNSTWSLLHSMAADYPEKPTREEQKAMGNFICILSKVYPCQMCAEHFRQQITEYPPIVLSKHDLSQWLCTVHNNVNRSIGKPEFDCKLVDERWKTGWADGSCD